MSQILLEKKDVIRNIGIGEMAASNKPAEVLATYSLGTCIGLTLYDPVVRVGGMIHCKLAYAPKPLDESKNPAVYIDWGVPLFVDKVLKLGAKKTRLIAKLAGAFVAENQSDVFRIGERNYAVMNDLLASLGIRIQSEECGGNIPRTMYLFMEDGRTVIRSKGASRDI